MIKLHFPFTVDGQEKSTEVKTHIERLENVISFSLEYKMNITIEKGKCLSIQKLDEGYVYVFDNINDAIDFEEKKECKVSTSGFFSDPAEIEREIVEYAEVYVNTGAIKKKQRKTLVEDENGFKKYI